jgi:signal transduction histidine kinase
MLLRLVNDILALSSLENGEMTINPKETDFAKCFDALSDSLAERVVNPKVTFLTDNPYTTYVTTLDDGRIQQVITNFVTNAIKYTHEGHIKIGYKEETRHNLEGLYIYCEDTGEGIPQEHQQKVFERFVKLNDFIQGTGLGLNICKVIADNCNGEIGVHSEGKGQGSTFWLWIPAKKQLTL